MSSSVDDPSSSSSSTTPQHSLLPNVRPALEKNGCLAVWRLPADISQSRLCGRTAASNACTLIALQLIELFERRDLHFITPSHHRPPLTFSAFLRARAGAETLHSVPTVCARYVVGTFIEAMVEGNEAHGRAIETRSSQEHHNFTIPDAIAALNRPLTEIDYCAVTGPFTHQLPRFIRIALRNPSLLPLMRLHFVIIAFERTVLLVADRKTNSFILLDSHLHGSAHTPPTGAVVAAAHFSELAVLIEWMAHHIFPETHFPSIVQEFEISTVVYAGTTRDCAVDETSRGGVGAASRPPSTPVPVMKPMPIFTQPAGKENLAPSSIVKHSMQHPQQLQQPPKKLNKRSADSQEPAPLGSSSSKRIRPGPETTSQITVPDAYAD